MVRVVLEGGPLGGFETTVPQPEEVLRPVLLDQFDAPHRLNGYYVRRSDDHEFQPWVYYWRRA